MGPVLTAGFTLRGTQQNVKIKSSVRSLEGGNNSQPLTSDPEISPHLLPSTTHHLLFVEHPPVYTLGKSGKIENVIIGEEERVREGIDFFHGGWFNFELYNDEKLLEKNKFYLSKMF